MPRTAGRRVISVEVIVVNKVVVMTGVVVVSVVLVVVVTGVVVVVVVADVVVVGVDVVVVEEWSVIVVKSDLERVDTWVSAVEVVANSSNLDGSLVLDSRVVEVLLDESVVVEIWLEMVVYSVRLSYLPSKTALTVFIRGNLPWLQNFPSKSSKSNDLEWK